MIRLLQPSDIDEVMETWLQSTKIAHPFIEATYWEKNYDLVKKSTFLIQQLMFMNLKNLFKDSLV